MRIFVMYRLKNELKFLTTFFIITINTIVKLNGFQIDIF